MKMHYTKNSMIRYVVSKASGYVLSLVFLILGISAYVPSKTIPMGYYHSGYTEYVGGDAYNIMIEASLRAGEISGGEAKKAVFYAASGILFFLTLAFDCRKMEETAPAALSETE